MPSVRCACPRCQMQLQFEGELPMRAQCPGCQTVITVGATGGSSGVGSWASRVKPSAAKVSAVGARPAAPPAATAPQDEPVVRLRRPQRKTRVLPYVVVGGALLAILGGLVALLVLRGGKDGEDTSQQGGGGPSFAKTLGGGPKSAKSAVDLQQQRINQAIERGVAYLKKQIFDGNSDYYFYDKGSSSRLGVLALAGLTLLECRDQLGLDPEIPKAVEKVVDTIRHEAPTENFRFTYTLALAVLFLDRWCEAKDRKTEERDVDLIRRLATRMIAAQNENGGWDYYCPAISEEKHQEILKTLNAGGSVPKRQHEKDDNSINQFCTLALWAARKHGIRTDTVLKAIEDRYRKNQNEDGSWGYRAKDKGLLRDATTCAGLIGLAVGHGVDKLKEEEDLKKHIAKGEKPKEPVDVTKADPAIKKGLEYIAPRIRLSPAGLGEKTRATRHQHTKEMMDLFREWHAARTDDEREAIKRKVEKLDNARLLRGTYFNADSWGDLYFLWSVERTAEIFGLKTINGRDWYSWGSDLILKFQKEDGSWRDRFPGVCDTCFALLFLRKANMAKDLTNKLRGVRTAPGVSAVPPPRRPVPDQPRRRPEA